MTNLPQMRMNDLVVQELDQEVLIYDLKINKAYCLNSVSAEIWKKCDGLTTVREIAEMIGKQMNIKLDDDFVWLAIADLEKNKLLIGEVKRPSEFENLSRRKVLFKYALPTLVLPLISSIVAPTSVNAQSATACPAIPPGCTGGIPGGIPTGCPCTLNCSNCLPGACNLGTMMCV